MKKLFNFKNIMFVLCVGIAIISTFFSCEVRAYTWEEFTDFIADYNSVSELSSGTRDVCDWFNNFKNTIHNKNSSFIESCENFYISRYWNTSSRKYYYYFWCSTGSSNITYNSNKVSCVNPCSAYMYIRTHINDKYYIDNYNVSTANGGVPDNGGEGSAGLINFEPLSSLNANTYFQNYYIQPITFEFTPYGFQLSGDSSTYWNKFAYVSGFIPLGLLGDNTYYQLDIKLRDENGYDVGNYSDVPGVGSISDDHGRIIKVENNIVYVNAIYLAYYRNYNLLFKVWENSTDFSSYIYAYEFMPFSAVIENGQIVSSGDTTFSGGDATILITDNMNDYSDIYNILSVFGSGDFIVSGDDFNVSGDDFNVSGDLFTLLGYSDFDNNYKDFVYNGIYHNLKDVFLSSNDREFSFLFMGRNITINSNSFTTPNGVLKTFVSSFLVFGTIYYFYKTTIHFYHKMQEGNQLEAVQTWSVDDESILM